MSNLTGHSKMTRQAVSELAQEKENNPVFRELPNQSMPMRAQLIDIIDVATTGHWRDFGQKHHFMRFAKQTSLEGYNTALTYIKDLANEAAGYLSQFLRGYGRPSDNARVVVLAGVTWQNLGFAVHAVQDSFARGHTTRKDPSNAAAPGAIEYLKVYAGEDKENHEEYDKLWWDEQRKTFSRDGRFAINATKELILITLYTGLRRYHGFATPLIKWQQFVDRWLAKAKELGKNDDSELATNPSNGWTTKTTNLPPAEWLTGVQTRLNLLGFDCGPVNDKFTTKTRDAVIAFQKKNSLNPDGIPGPKTQARLKEVVGA